MAKIFTPAGDKRKEVEYMDMIMHGEGYCPYKDVSYELCRGSFVKLLGLWELVGPHVTYEPASERYNQIFYEDLIALKLLPRLTKRAVNAEKILVRHGTGVGILEIVDEAQNPELVLAPQSSFAVVLADADYGADLWVWRL